MNDGSNASHELFYSNWLNAYAYASEAEMPAEKRRIQERERQLKEAAKRSPSLQGWLQKSQSASEIETL